MKGRGRPVAAVIIFGTLIIALGGVARAGGVSGYEQKSSTFSISGGVPLTASALCSSGNVPLSGGFSASSTNVKITSSLPAAQSPGWTVTFNNTGRLSQSVTVSVICVASSSVPGYETPSTTITLKPNTSADVNMACSAGNVVVGGGFSVADSSIVTVANSNPTLSSNVTKTNWDVFATNASTTVAENVTSEAICVSNAISNYEEVLNQSSVPNGPATLSASCSAGNEVLGGGFELESPTIVPLTASQASSATAWSISATNLDTVNSRVISTIAICATPPPAVTGVSPTSGPTAGGTSVTITGTDLGAATAVKFGANAASSFTVNSPTQITATAPAGSAATVDVTVTTPDGTTATSAFDQYTFVAPPAVTGVNPSTGLVLGGTSITITGTNFTGATAVRFGNTSAVSFSVDSATQITATSPAGNAGTVDVTVTGPGGTSAATAGDRYTYSATLPQRATVPLLVEGAPVVSDLTTVGFSGSVNPNGLSTRAHFEYKLDPSLGGPAGARTYDQQTPTQAVGSDSTSHPVSAKVTGLVPNATYHVRLVAVNSAGTSFGSDQTFTTGKAPPPPAPVLGKTANVTPVSGLVLIKPPPGKTLHAISAATPRLVKGTGFVPLTQARQIPDGSQIDARAGTLNVVVANGQRRHTQQATLTGSVFSLSQTPTGRHKGLTTFALLEGAFPGAPTYNSCTAHPTAHGLAQTAAKKPPSHNILQTLHASDNHGSFRTKGRYSAATVRGTKWDTIDRCDGTLTAVHRGTVDVLDFARRKTITVHAGHSYLAKAPTTHKHVK